MGRINLEDHFWVEIMPLAKKLKDQDLAIGQVVRFWRLIQEKHKYGKTLDEAEFKAHDFSEHLFDYFAVRTETGITARGAGKHFDWLKSRVTSGKTGGSKTKQTKAKRTKKKQTEPSYSSSSSCSSSSSSSDSVSQEDQKAPDETGETPQTTGNLRSLLFTLHNEIHGTDPEWNASIGGMLKNLIKLIGIEDAPKVLELYYRYPNSYYKTQGHPLALLLKDRAKLLTEARRGSPIIPDGREKAFKDSLNYKSREQEIENHFRRREQ
jgi:hypothetical protein